MAALPLDGDMITTSTRSSISANCGGSGCSTTAASIVRRPDAPRVWVFAGFTALGMRDLVDTRRVDDVAAIWRVWSSARGVSFAFLNNEDAGQDGRRESTSGGGGEERTGRSRAGPLSTTRSLSWLSIRNPVSRGE